METSVPSAYEGGPGLHPCSPARHLGALTSGAPGTQRALLEPLAGSEFRALFSISESSMRKGRGARWILAARSGSRLC
jgi:hypothetical protein